jgi:hypothetical protein
MPINAGEIARRFAVLGELAISALRGRSIFKSGVSATVPQEGSLSYSYFEDSYATKITSYTTTWNTAKTTTYNTAKPTSRSTVKTTAWITSFVAWDGITENLFTRRSTTKTTTWNTAKPTSRSTAKPTSRTTIKTTTLV